MVASPWTAPRFSGEAEDLPRDEQVAVLAMAEGFDVPATLLAAIRLAEQGRAGLEYGVKSDAHATTYGMQCRDAAESIANNIHRYTNATKLSPWGHDGTLTDGYLAFLASRYCPVGAADDPTGLNRNWLGNISRVYRNSSVVPA